jgi:carboxypeptidase Q
MIHPRTFAVASLVVALTAALPLASQDSLDPAINSKIRQDEAIRSQVMRTLHYLTDVYGPRLTGSPNHKAAAEWAVKQMTGWGMTNGHLEPWDFGHPGWVNERLSVHVVSPLKDALAVEALAWTPGTNGSVTAKTFQMVLPESPEPAAAPPMAGRGNPTAPPSPAAPSSPGAPSAPSAAGEPPAAGGRGAQRPGLTQAELDAYLALVKDKVRGAAVMVGKSVSVPVNLTPPPGRLTDEQARCRFDPNMLNAPECEGMARGRGGFGPGRGQPPADGRLTQRQIDQRIDEFLVANGAVLRISDAGRAHGQIIAFNNRTYDVTKAVPTVVMRNEDYGRLSRIMADGTPVEVEATIVNQTYPEGRTSYNAIAEIAGSDLKDEVIMAGGHLDSWHSATGATDNAIGCAIMMEAARILKSINAKPRRTIRIALWSGEEEGLLGSQAYVKEHFGSAEAPKPEFAKFNGYLNVDTGTGRLRGASIFGPPEAARILADILAPFKDLKMYGATETSSRAMGGTDSTSFNNAGLPGIGFTQDTIEYNTHTHHTNLDTYERVIEADVRDAAVVVAGTLYQLANRDAMLPRFSSTDMPAAPPQRQGGF